METALSVYADGAIELADLERELLVERQKEVSAYKYVPVKYTVGSGGITSFVNKDTGKTMDSITGIVIISQQRNTFYESKKINNDRPLCASPDGKYGYLLDPIPQERFKQAMRARVPHPGLVAVGQGLPPKDSYACKGCPMFEFGSAFQDPENPDGKACKESRWLLVIPQNQQRPVVITVPTMSLKAWDAHCSSLEDNDPFHQYFCSWTTLTVVGASNNRYKFGVIKPKFEGWLDKETIGAVVAARRQYAEYARQAEVDAGDVYGSNGDGNGRQVDDDGVIVEGESLPPF